VTTGAVARAFALAVALAGCSVDPVDYSGKTCPCLAGMTCKVGTKECIVYPGAPDPSLGCAIYSDGKLYCSDTAGSAMRSAPMAAADVVDTLRTSYSWFTCWGTGELHSGGNTTWYYTQGDDNGHWGWLPGVNVNTPDPFDADPASFGLAVCAAP